VELATETGASRKTVRRVLGTFEGHGWTVRRESVYKLTPLGRVVAEAVADLRNAMAAVRTLRPVLPYLPAEISLDLRRLHDARVTAPEATTPVAPASRMVEVLREAEAVTVVAFSVVPDALSATCENARPGDLLLASETLTFIAESSGMAPMLTEMFDAGWTVAELADPPPYNLVLADRTVMLGLVDESGAASALIESDDEAARRWATGVVDAAHERATVVDRSRFRT
jgi:predicted transcriptional regulator